MPRLLKTTITFTVLHREDEVPYHELQQMDIAAIAYEGTHGYLSVGDDSSLCETLMTPEEAKRECAVHGTDFDFFYTTPEEEAQYDNP